MTHAFNIRFKLLHEGSFFIIIVILIAINFLRSKLHHHLLFHGSLALISDVDNEVILMYLVFFMYRGKYISKRLFSIQKRHPKNDWSIPKSFVSFK